MNAKIYLKPDKDRIPKKGNAWVFSGAVARVEGQPDAGETVKVLSDRGEFIAWGHWNPTSQIRVRLFDWKESTIVDQEFWRSKLRLALELRKPLEHPGAAQRLVFSEGDGLPGLVIDRLGTTGVLQLLTSGMDSLRETWTKLIREEIPQIVTLVERSDGDGRRQEGLAEKSGLLYSDLPPGEGALEIQEEGLKFLVDPLGQKTGFYSDQRLNRQRVKAWARGRDCADVFCYTGAFSCHLMAGGARSVTLTDASAGAIDMAVKNLSLGGWKPLETVTGDAFTVLREWKKASRKFGLIVLDPPKLVSSKQGLEKGLGAYKDLNLQALALLEPGGILATFSCSGLVSREDFLQAVNYAVKDSGRRVQILEHLSQAPDHPVMTTHPEGAYLKGLILRVL